MGVFILSMLLFCAVVTWAQAESEVKKRESELSECKDLLREVCEGCQDACEHS